MSNKAIFLFMSIMIPFIVPGKVMAQESNSYVQKAYEALDGEDYETVLYYVIRLLHDNPNDSEALVLKAAVYYRYRKLPPALEAINHAILVNKPEVTGRSESNLYWWQGLILSEMGNMEEAVVSYEKAYSLVAADELNTIDKIGVNYALALYYTDQIDKSDNIYMEILQRDPINDDALYGLARNAYTRGRHNEALSYINSNEGLATYYLLCKIYTDLGFYDLAIQYATKLVDYSNHPEALYLRAQAYHLNGEYEKAITDYSLVIREDNYILDKLYYLRGWCYSLKRDYESAYSDFCSTIDYNKDYIYSYLFRGDALLAMGFEEDAKTDYETVLQKDTLAIDGSCRMYALHYFGRDREAEEWMNTIISNEPDNPGHYYDKACLLSRMGRYEESLQALQIALKKGFCRFSIIENDDDMDPLRGMPAYQEMLEKYIREHEALKCNYINQK